MKTLQQLKNEYASLKKKEEAHNYFEKLDDEKKDLKKKIDRLKYKKVYSAAAKTKRYGKATGSLLKDVGRGISKAYKKADAKSRARGKPKKRKHRKLPSVSDIL